MSLIFGIFLKPREPALKSPGTGRHDLQPRTLPESRQEQKPNSGNTAANLRTKAVILEPTTHIDGNLRSMAGKPTTILW